MQACVVVLAPWSWASSSWAEPPAEAIMRAVAAVTTSSTALAQPCRAPRAIECAKDDVEAARLFIKGCELNGQTCVDAGGRLLKGWGVPQDLAQGRAVLERACADRDTHACVVLAEHLHDRDPPDLAGRPSSTREPASAATPTAAPASRTHA